MYIRPEDEFFRAISKSVLSPGTRAYSPNVDDRQYGMPRCFLSARKPADKEQRSFSVAKLGDD
jgi:hypothetical protein